jgi:hypothetical protein
MFHVAVLTPSSGKCEFQYAQSLANLVLHFATNKVMFNDDYQGMQIMGQQSFSTSCNREMLIDALIDKEFSHVLFIDDDMQFEPSILNDLARRELDFVVCDYPRKKIPRSTIAVGLDDEPMKKDEGLEEAKQVGFGMALIKMDVVKCVKKPRFPLPFNSSTGEYGSEDYFFCMRARENGYRIWVDHDASKKVGHIGSYMYK